MAAHIVVIIPTIGRAAVTAALVRWLERQQRRPDRVVVVGVRESDVEGVGEGSTLAVEVLRGDKGLTKQRNQGLRHVAGAADLIVFFDDDFFPAPAYLASVEAAFAADPDLVGLTGRLIADGIHNAGYTPEEALAMIEADVPPPPEARRLHGLYGCNMAYRASATEGLWFDERLPLYGWQEDVDFSVQVGRRGHNLKSSSPAGVHLGAKGGRTPGKPLGYSQVANPIYLLGKRTIPPKLAWRIMLTNIAANATRAFTPEPHIDRAGRFRGNLIAIGHLLTGRLAPERILDF